MNAILAILLDQTTNTHFLNPMQWLILLTSPPEHPSIRGRHSTTYHKVLHRLEKTVLRWTPVNVLAIYTGSNHRRTEPSTAVHTCSAAWIHLDAFPPMKDALPRTTRIFDIWKTTDQYCH